MTYAVLQAAAGFGDAAGCPWNQPPSYDGFGDVPGMTLRNPGMFDVVGGLVYVSEADGGHGPIRDATKRALAGGRVISVRQLSPTATETIVVGLNNPVPAAAMAPGAVLLASVLGLDAADEDDRGIVPVRTVLTTSAADVAAMAVPGAQPEVMAILDGDPAIIAAAARPSGVEASLSVPGFKLGTVGTVAVLGGAAALLYLVIR